MQQTEYSSQYFCELCVLVTTLNNMEKQQNNPLHGKTLEMILNHLVELYGWEDLGNIIKINCFMHDPSIKSSLTFLRKTPWARKKVEELYLDSLRG
jgi:uncharacterized protein (DUF2132 family)